MQCPVCDERMREVERSGVTIDICPGCKGVWLDRGELEKLLARAAQEETAAPREERREREEAVDRHDAHDDRPREHRDHGHEREREQEYGQDRSGRPRRRGSWLSDILEGIGGGD